MHDDNNVYGQQTFVSGIKSDTVDEKTGAAGVTIDTVLIKDGLVDGIDVADLATGWIAGTTWTYATASTFTVAGDLTATFQKGTKAEVYPNFNQVCSC